MRKLGTGLASVLSGLNMFELAVKPNKVQADAVTDKTLKEESSQRQFGDKFAIFGKIIPVNEKQAFIKSVKAVNYRRDPNNPDKALPTPPPTIKGYQVSKKTRLKIMIKIQI